MTQIKECQYCKQEYVWAKDLGKSCRVCKNGMYRYGMNRNDMVALHESQDGCCAVCGLEVELFNGSTGAVIDHCHASGNVRSILCQSCNIAAGKLETHPNIAKLLEYIGYGH